MNLRRKALHVHATGRSGTGKTSLCERYVVGSKYGEVFIFDHQSELAERLGVQPFYNIDDVFSEKERRVKCYDPSYQFAGSFIEAFDAFSEAVFGLVRNRKTLWETLLVCDEVQQMSPLYAPSVGFLKCLQTGRRFGLDTFTMSQQPNRISSQLREQFTEVYFTQLVDDNSLKFSRDFGIDDETIRGLQVVDEVEANYLWLNTRTGERRNGKILFKK